MQIQQESLKASFVANIGHLETALDSRSSAVLINDQLEVVSKRSITMLALTILQCIVSIFVNFDLKAHLRAVTVAEQILNYCELNRQYLETDPDLVCRIANSVFQKFNERTHGLYTKEIKDCHNTILQIGRHIGFAIPAPSRKELFELEVTPEEFAPMHKLLTEIAEKFNTTLHYLVFSKTQGPNTSHRSLRVYRRLCFSSKFPDFSEPALVERHDNLPFSLELQYDGALLKRIIVMFKKIVGEGSNRKIRACLGYGPEGKESLVRGHCVNSSTERTVLKYFQKHPSIGLPSVQAWRTVNQPHKPQNPEKLQFIQKKHPGNLFHFLTEHGFEPKAHMFTVIRDLVTGLKRLHEFVLPSQCYKDHDGHLRLFPSVKGAHFDIGSDNVLITDRYEALLIDFEYVCALDQLPCKQGYMTPEIAKFLLSLDTQEDPLSSLFELNTEHGQAKDIWCMGIVLFDILLGLRSLVNPKISEPLENLSKFQFITDAYSFYPQGSIPSEDIDRAIEKMRATGKTKPEELTKEYVQGFIRKEKWFDHINAVTAHIDQQKLDRDIDNHRDFFQEHNPDFGHTDELWSVLKGMLKVDPKQRMTANEVFEKLDPILPTRVS